MSLDPGNLLLLLLWALVALAVWPVFLALLRPLGDRGPVVISAVMSWLVARLIVWAVINASHWIHGASG